MVNVIIGTVLLLCSLYVGSEMGKYWRRREYFFADLVAFCSKLESEIGLFQNKLCEIFMHAGGRKEFQKLCTVITEMLKQNNEIKEDVIKTELLDARLVSNEEASLILEFLISLGRLDAEEQISRVKRFRQSFEQKLSESSKENKKKGSLSLRLGFLAGCLCFILVL